LHSCQDGAAYLEAFLMVLRNVTKEETVQYVMALIDEMLSGELHMQPEGMWDGMFAHN
jgi:hypothetical protein